MFHILKQLYKSEFEAVTIPGEMRCVTIWEHCGARVSVGTAHRYRAAKVRNDNRPPEHALSAGTAGSINRSLIFNF